MNNLQISDLSLIIVANKAVQNGLGIAFPWGEGTPFDIIIYDQNGVFIPVQIKTAYKRYDGRKGFYAEVCKNSYNRRTRIQRISYTKNEIKFIIVVNVKTEDFWLIPLSFIGNKKKISLQTTPSNYINSFSELFKNPQN
jgi:hypothetical protein